MTSRLKYRKTQDKKDWKELTFIDYALFSTGIILGYVNNYSSPDHMPLWWLATALTSNLGVGEGFVKGLSDWGRTDDHWFVKFIDNLYINPIKYSARRGLAMLTGVGLGALVNARDTMVFDYIEDIVGKLF